VLLGQLTGDNLGIHKLLGYSESFVANDPYRFCRMHRQQCQTACRLDSSLLRNRQNYEQDPQLSSLRKTGVKNASNFNELPDFHITENFCPDIMHDVFEGIAPLDIRILLNKLITSGQLSLSGINSRIDRFNFGHFKKDKPSPITLQNLRSTSTRMGQSASQMCTLVLKFGLLFRNLFSKNCLTWKLYILLREILDVILSPSVSAVEIPYLESIIEDHHYLYQRLYGLTLIPKHHHLLHYPHAIRQVGPILNFWAMRFEGRHRFLKHVANISCNFKNIAKTVTKRNQMCLSYKFLLNRPFRDQYISEVSELVQISDTEFLETISQTLGTDEGVIHILNSLENESFKIKPKDVLVKCWNDPNCQPLFIRVELLFRHDSTYFLVHKIYRTLIHISMPLIFRSRTR